MKDIVFITQLLSQPRCIKRIESFIDEGYNCKVYGFVSGLYEDNLRNANFKIDEARSLDKKLSRFKKIIEYIKLILYVKKQINSKSIVYAFGFEIGMFVSLIFRRNYIYEEADVSASRFQNRFLKKFFLRLDKKIIKKSTITIFTSEGFQDYIFPDGNPYSSKTIFIHNKLHESFNDLNRKKYNNKFSSNSIIFGFAGLIRYPNTILRFARVVGESFPEHEFHFWGDAETDISNYCDWLKYKNIFFHGPFKNPENLEEIYNQIDLNIACYDPTSENVKIAEPNKFYESIFFGKPIIVSRGTFLEKRVKKLEVGYAINACDNNAIKIFVSGLNKDSIQNKIKNCLDRPSDELVTNKKNDIGMINELLFERTLQ